MCSKPNPADGTAAASALATSSYGGVYKLMETSRGCASGDRRGSIAGAARAFMVLITDLEGPPV